MIQPDYLPAWARPIRIPSDIEITHADPPYAIVGQPGYWRIPFRLSKDVMPGSDLRVQLWGGRNNRGAFLPVKGWDAGYEGLIAAELEDGSPMPVTLRMNSGECSLAVPPDGLKKGCTVVVRMGDRLNIEQGLKATPIGLLNKFIVLYVPSSASSVPGWSGGSVWNPQTQQGIVAAVTLHFLGGSLSRLRVYAPSTVRSGATLTLLVRPEDEFGNQASQRLGAVEVWDETVRLPVQTEDVPESTCIRLKCVLTGDGVHRIRVRDSRSGLDALSNPLVCGKTATPTYWGMIHGHTELSDGTGKIDQYFHQLKNELQLDFAATSDHDHLWETPDEYWGIARDAVRRWNGPGSFVALLGYEWAKWRQNGDGDRNVYYRGGAGGLYRSDEGEYPTPPNLFQALKKNTERALIIPHHTGHGGNFCDWKDHDPEFERLVEIFQVRGSYECAEEDGNPVPERKGSIPFYSAGTVRQAMAQGWRVGFTAGGDDHDGQWGSEFRFERNGYKQGLMSVEAPACTSDDIFDALYQRRVVATTGARILLTYRLNGQPMGSELALSNAKDLDNRRHLEIEFHGTAPLNRIDIIRNNQVVQVLKKEQTLDWVVTWDDVEPLTQIWLPSSKFCAHPFTFYYLRAIQEDGEVAWASPVWIDP